MRGGHTFRRSFCSWCLSWRMVQEVVVLCHSYVRVSLSLCRVGRVGELVERGGAKLKQLCTRTRKARSRTARQVAFLLLTFYRLGAPFCSSATPSTRYTRPLDRSPTRPCHAKLARLLVHLATTASGVHPSLVARSLMIQSARIVPPGSRVYPSSVPISLPLTLLPSPLSQTATWRWGAISLCA